MAKVTNDVEPVPSDPKIRFPSCIVPTCDCFVEKGMNYDRDLGIHRCAKCGAFEDYSGKSPHQQRIEHFMSHIGHQVEASPTLPSEPIRRFRASLILEEALETIKALGFTVSVNQPPMGYEGGCYFICNNSWLQISEVQLHEPDLVEIVDGCCDISVVTIGTLSACGVTDKNPLEAVDLNNIAKFEPKCPNCNESLHPMNDGHTDRGDPRVEGWSCWACETYYPKEIGGYRRDDGKWIKGVHHKKVDLAQVLAKQAAKS